LRSTGTQAFGQRVPGPSSSRPRFASRPGRLPRQRCGPKVNGYPREGPPGEPGGDLGGERAAPRPAQPALPTSSRGLPGHHRSQQEDASYPSPTAYIGIGMVNAICLLAGGALGWLLDRSIGTLPVFLLVGLLVGAGAGVAATRAELRRYKR
jgi:hypothetical protein